MKAQFLTKKFQNGFTLAEFILALSFGSFVILSAAQSYSLLHQHINFLYQSHRLDQVIRQIKFIIEKDLRRAGFCNGTCPENPIIITSKNGEASHSCIIAAYDLNRDGQWKKPAAGLRKAEYFGYRLKDNMLEESRNSTDCQNGHWVDLLDPQEIVVTHFLIKQQAGNAGKSLFSLQLTAHRKRHAKIRQQVNWVVIGYNA